jgi:hypothetical protein
MPPFRLSQVAPPPREEELLPNHIPVPRPLPRSSPPQLLKREANAKQLASAQPQVTFETFQLKHLRLLLLLFLGRNILSSSHTLILHNHLLASALDHILPTAF